SRLQLYFDSLTFPALFRSTSARSMPAVQQIDDGRHYRLRLRRLGHDLATVPFFKRGVAAQLSVVENKWRAAAAELSRDRRDGLVTNAHVENCRRNTRSFHRNERVLHGAASPDDFGSGGFENLFQFHEEDGVVFDDEQAHPFQGVAMSRVASYDLPLHPSLAPAKLLRPYRPSHHRGIHVLPARQELRSRSACCQILKASLA